MYDVRVGDRSLNARTENQGLVMEPNSTPVRNEVRVTMQHRSPAFV